MKGPWPEGKREWCASEREITQNPREFRHVKVCVCQRPLGKLDIFRSVVSCFFLAILIFGGCFWGSEKGIWRLPAGIFSTAVGYAAGCP